jgi:hypothetical protein
MNESAHKSQANLNVQAQPQKKVKPWAPVNIPPREKKLEEMEEELKEFEKER